MLSPGFQAETPGDALIGRPAPAFQRQDLDGNTVDMGQLRGRIVLLNFWASWCAPCLKEMPRFEILQKQMGAGQLQVIGVSMDDDPQSVRKVLNRMGIDYPVVMGDVALGRLYGGILGLPVTYLIDSQGVVRYRFQGDGGPEAVEKALNQLMWR